LLFILLLLLHLISALFDLFWPVFSSSGYCCFIFYDILIFIYLSDFEMGSPHRAYAAQVLAVSASAS
jgi:hypothetical protein